MIGKVLFHLINGGGSAGGIDMVIDAEDHLFIRMAQPCHRLFDGDTGGDDHGAIGMAEIMAADGHRMSSGGRQGMKPGLVGTVKGGLRHDRAGGGGTDKPCMMLQEGAEGREDRNCPAACGGFRINQQGLIGLKADGFIHTDDTGAEVYIIRGEGEDFTAPEARIKHDERGKLEAVRDAEDEGYFIILQRTVGTGGAGGRLGRLRFERILDTEIIFNSSIKEILIEHVGAVNGGSGITEEVLPDGGNIIHSDS